ncbi:membrane protein [Vibrio harveyi]|uniref:membrane protein n=1 Tax=Vibrio harveyi TaxID=669 RepID=UPI00066EBC3C|nr:membrane protein [Vibrio harveyi]
MSLYNIYNKNLIALTQTTFAAEGLQERQDLQEALKGCIDAIAPDCLVISEEFSDWEDSRRRIDLLAIDRNANLVVIELKRDEIGAHMELQALRYAAMISTMTFDKACEYFERYIAKEELEINARETILEFVDLDESSLDDFGNDVRIVLASADFGKELTTSVLWLRDKGINISCVRLTPYRYKDDVLINAEQIIPVPEVEAYQVKFREKQAEQRISKKGQRDYSKYRFNGQVYNKRNLALAVLTHWIEQENPQSLSVIKDALKDYNLPRAVALFEEIADKHMSRYHSAECDLITLTSGELIAISNQWGDNIPRLLDVMKSYGIAAERIEN